MGNMNMEASVCRIFFFLIISVCGKSGGPFAADSNMVGTVRGETSSSLQIWILDSQLWE